MPPIFFAIISYLAWGIADLFGTITSRRIGSYSTTVWYLVLGFPIFILIAPFFIHNLQFLTPTMLIFNIFLGIVGAGGFVCFYEGLRIEHPSLVATIAASYGAIAAIFSIFFFQESLNLNQVIDIITIFLGVVIVSLDFKELIKIKISSSNGIALALGAMLLWAIYWAFIKIPIRQVGWFWPNVISSFSFLVILLFMKFRNIKLIHPNYNGAALPLLTMTLLQEIGALSLNYAISIGQTAIVAPIAGSAVTLFVVLAFLFFKDPITRQQILGIITTLVGIILLSVFSV